MYQYEKGRQPRRKLTKYLEEITKAGIKVHKKLEKSNQTLIMGNADAADNEIF